jgi:organic radical activating enzyme
MSEFPQIVDHFLSYQGTGHLVGKRQYFIRFAGCSVKCPIRTVCDEPDALDTGAGERVCPEILADKALAAVGTFGWVHITGGEPCEQGEALTALSVACERRKLRVHLQTSGVVRVPIRTDWLTISPKAKASRLCWNRSRWANEMVVVYDPSWIIDQAELHAFQLLTRCYDYYLCPLFIDDKSINVTETVEMCERMNSSGGTWDMTGQFHKYMGLR